MGRAVIHIGIPYGATAVKALLGLGGNRLPEVVNLVVDPIGAGGASPVEPLDYDSPSGVDWHVVNNCISLVKGLLEG